MNIRPARQADASSLSELLAQMGVNYKRTSKEIKDRISAYQRDSHQLLVAEESGKIIGLIAFACYEQFRLQGCCCHIDTLVIDVNYRDRGIGRKLLICAERYAKENGATEIELTTANLRRKNGTHDFYKRMGYIDHLEMDCSYFAKQVI